jgi:DNA-binding NarL/FixJ family response regulator
MIKILLVDDHKIVRAGLRALIAGHPDMAVVAEAGDGRTAVELAAEVSPDVIIMDISMPGLNGTEATRRILEANPNARVIALSMHLERRMVLQMLGAGAKGYLLKDGAEDEVIDAILAVAQNTTYLSPRISSMVLKDYVERVSKKELSSISLLSSREREVLQLLAEGKKTKDIAALLNVSIKTAEFYRQQIMEKLDIHTIAELTKVAIREGLTTL